MKKLLQFIFAASLSIISFEGRAQLQNGSFAPDWTFTDILGNSHHLYADLDAGYTVYIDVSATWCGPCWNYHNTGALENLWVNHGPTGGNNVSSSTTNNCMVYFIEGDAATNNADLNGTGSNTQGNWVAGVSHPIIDPISPGTFNSNYGIAYFPTIYMICPDRIITEVGQVNDISLYAARSTCNLAIAAADAEMITVPNMNSYLASCDSVNPSFILGNVGTDTLTSATLTYQVDAVTQRVYNWTGSLAPYNHVTVTGIKLGSSISGGHSIQVLVSNPNGQTDPSSSNNSAISSFLIYSGSPVAPIVETFETSGIPATWGITNGGGTTWINGTTGFNSTKSAKLPWNGMAAGDIDYMTLEPQNFVGFTTVSLTFEVAYPTSQNDKLQVEVSNNCGASWSIRYTRAGTALSTTGAVTGAFTPTSSTQWRMETVNFNSYAGQPNVWIRFKGIADGGNNVYVDDINFIGATGIAEEVSIGSVNVFPNPTNGNSTVNFDLIESSDVTITLVDALGQVVQKDNLGYLQVGEQNYLLNTESLSGGLYYLNITSGTHTVTTKLAVNN